MTIETVTLEQLHLNKANPRKSMDAAALEGLAASIATDGLLQNLVVRPRRGGKAYDIISGERRFRALRLLAERGDIEKSFPVPVEIRKGLSKDDGLRIATAAALIVQPPHNCERVGGERRFVKVHGAVLAHGTLNPKARHKEAVAHILWQVCARGAHVQCKRQRLQRPAVALRHCLPRRCDKRLRDKESADPDVERIQRLARRHVLRYLLQLLDAQGKVSNPHGHKHVVWHRVPQPML